MTDQKSTNVYVIVCIVQSAIIMALAFYVGHLKTQTEELTKENERNGFALQINNAQLSRMKGILDTCGTKK